MKNMFTILLTAILTLQAQARSWHHQDWLGLIFGAAVVTAVAANPSPPIIHETVVVQQEPIVVQQPVVVAPQPTVVQQSIIVQPQPQIIVPQPVYVAPPIIRTLPPPPPRRGGRIRRR